MKTPREVVLMYCAGAILMVALLFILLAVYAPQGAYALGGFLVLLCIVALALDNDRPND